MAEVTTSDKHKVFLKDSVTHAEYKAIRRQAQSLFVVDFETQQVKNPTLADMQAVSRLVLDQLVVKILLPDGTEAKDCKAEIDNMPDDDEQMLINKANKIIKTIVPSKKNETAS
jgi:hypothetical protein